MTRIRRFRAVSTVLLVAAVITSAHVFGDADNPAGKGRERPLVSGSQAFSDTGLSADLAKTKFTDAGLVTYRTKDGEWLFALQIKPKLEAAGARPRDFLVLVDTSASQAGQPLAAARQVARQLAAAAGPEDRLALWTINIPEKESTRCLSGGFRQASSERLSEALKQLDQEVPLGATDLGHGLRQALASFEGQPERQRVVVYLGDGMSVYQPLTPAERARLCQDMAKDEIAFFPVPVGPRLGPENLHGLASGTGGCLVRLLPQEPAANTVKRLCAAVAAPVLYSTRIDFRGAEVVEHFPTRLPPLRSDTPTLVVGKLQAGPNLGYAVEGTVAGRPAQAEGSEAMREPELDNFFLVGLVEQWKNAQDQPALLQADRALAFAQEINLMARSELLAQADEALARNHFDAAAKLFRRAQKLDPNDLEVQGGLKIVQALQDGKLTKKDLEKRVADGLSRGPAGKADKDASKSRQERFDGLLAQAGDQEQPAPAPGPATNPEDLLRQERLRQSVEEQRVTTAVDDALREARRLLPIDPDAAHDLLRRNLGAIRDNADLRDSTRQALLTRLENTLRFVDIEGARIRRDQAERLNLLARAEERHNLEVARTDVENRTAARMRVYHNLMNQARYEEATRQALAITQDNIGQGVSVPVSVTAGYQMGLNATNLRDVQELTRVRDERYLLTLMQVERSAVPFPDEPPVQFPPVATWRELSRIRKEKFDIFGFTDADPLTIKKIRDLQAKMQMPVEVPEDFASNTPLSQVIDWLSTRYGVTILPNTEAFKNDVQINDVENQPVKLQKMSGISFGTVLRILLSQVQGTYIIRKEFIEYTTINQAVSERVVRAYPVAELVTPIPKAVNQQAVNQSIQNSILGAQIQLVQAATFLGGGALGAVGGIGGIGGLGGLGGGGLGGLGAVAGIGGAQGGGIQPQNLGAGGGGPGFAGFGGQLGQFGNLGGQFGLQGGDTSILLMRLIRQVVGKPRDWAAPGIFERPTGANIPGAGNTDDEPSASDPNEAGALGYYPPSLALIVKNTSRIHTGEGGILGPRQIGPAPPAMGALDRKNQGNQLARGSDKGNALDKLAAAAADRSEAKVAKADTKNAKNKSKDDPKPEQLADLDARIIWQDALTRGVQEPGLIIAVSDYLAEHGKWEHAAEFLKANLRQAIVVKPWVYEALALALNEGKGSSEEVQRAQLSLIDVEPQDAGGYVKAAQAMAEHRHYDSALAFCKQAARLQPNAAEPYAEGLVYAEAAKDTGAMEWAAGNLVGRDWPAEGQDLHAKASEKLKSLVQTLNAGQRRDEARRLEQAVNQYRARDLVMTFTWQGEADVDVEVKEPIGSVCSFLQKQTPGGGTLAGGALSLTEAQRLTYTCVQAFRGDYQVTLRRVWGRPLGGKVTVEIIQHQGTPQESRHRESFTFEKEHTFAVTLDDGRRTSIAQVPPPPSRHPTADAVPPGGSDRVLNRLRALADPDLLAPGSRWQANLASLGVPEPTAFNPAKLLKRNPSDPLPYQTKVTSLVGNSLETTAQAEVVESKDGRFLRMKLSPVFQTVGDDRPGPVVDNPMIPGGSQG